jgi:hypothetical protein
MATSNGAVAVINGKIRRKGDSVGNGYKISSINANSGEVEISNAAGVKSVFKLKNGPDE